VSNQKVAMFSLFEDQFLKESDAYFAKESAIAMASGVSTFVKRVCRTINYKNLIIASSYKFVPKMKRK